jgi:(2Fe-2S) ferredoxin
MSLSRSLFVGTLLLVFSLGDAFLSPSSSLRRPTIVPATTGSDLDASAAGSFQILTCAATFCAARRKVLSLDPLATFSAFWERLAAAGLLHTIALAETSCLGACESAPCVAVAHDDYQGTVALAGMEPSEWVDRVFHSVTDEAEVDRVWGILQNAIEALDDDDDDPEIYDHENYV